MDQKVSKIIEYLLSLLEEKGEGEKEKVVEYLLKNLQEEKIRLTFARKIDSETEEKVKNSLRSIFGKDKKFNVEINPDIIGGFQAETKNNFIDCSVKTKLEKLWISLKI